MRRQADRKVKAKRHAMSWHDTQRAFAEAVRAPSLPVPEAVGRTVGQPSTKRFNVYRNNGAVSLTEALASAYPVVCELVGDEFFNGMARAFTGSHLPSSPVMLHYGAEFAEFIESFEPAASLPFLAGVARVERAWNDAYNAADCDPIGAQALQDVDPEALADARLDMHPSIRLIHSEWPVVSLWSAHQLDDPDERASALRGIVQQGEHGLIVRPDVDVTVLQILPPVWQLAHDLSAGLSLGEAGENLGDAAEEFGGILGYLFSIGAVVGIRPATDAGQPQ